MRRARTWAEVWWRIAHREERCTARQARLADRWGASVGTADRDRARYQDATTTGATSAALTRASLVGPGRQGNAIRQRADDHDPVAYARAVVRGFDASLYPAGVAFGRRNADRIPEGIVSAATAPDEHSAGIAQGAHDARRDKADLDRTGMVAPTHRHLAEVTGGGRVDPNGERANANHPRTHNDPTDADTTERGARTTLANGWRHPQQWIDRTRTGAAGYAERTLYTEPGTGEVTTDPVSPHARPLVIDGIQATRRIATQRGGVPAAGSATARRRSRAWDRVTVSQGAGGAKADSLLAARNRADSLRAYCADRSNSKQSRRWARGQLRALAKRGVTPHT